MTENRDVLVGSIVITLLLVMSCAGLSLYTDIVDRSGASNDPYLSTSW